MYYNSSRNEWSREDVVSKFFTEKSTAVHAQDFLILIYVFHNECHLDKN